MKTIERLDFPLRVYFRDGECYHDSAVIVFTHGAPAYVRASSPFVVYPWENIKHIIRVADETMEIADELKTARADARRLSTLLVSVVSRVSAAFGRPEPDPLDPGAAHDLAGNVKAICDDLASVTEQRDVLKRQLEELRAEVQESDSVKRVLQRQVDRLRHEPALSQPKQVEPGGPIWVRVVDTTSKYFGLVGRLEGILFRGDEEVWSVGFGAIDPVHQQANAFAVVGSGRVQICPTFEEQVKTFRELNPPAEPNADNRDSYRSTALRAGAKDCTLFVGPKPTDLTFVVEMREGAKVFDVVAALEHEHGLQPEAYRIREVRAPTT